MCHKTIWTLDLIKGADSKCTTTRRMRQNKTKIHHHHPLDTLTGLAGVVRDSGYDFRDFSDYCVCP